MNRLLELIEVYAMDFNYVMETLDLRFQTMSNENCGRL